VTNISIARSAKPRNSLNSVRGVKISKDIDEKEGKLKAAEAPKKYSLTKKSGKGQTRRQSGELAWGP